MRTVMRIALMIYVMHKELDVSPLNASINCLLSASRIYVMVVHNCSALEHIESESLEDYWWAELNALTL